MNNEKENNKNQNPEKVAPLVFDEHIPSGDVIAEKYHFKERSSYSDELLVHDKHTPAELFLKKQMMFLQYVLSL